MLLIFMLILQYYFDTLILTNHHPIVTPGMQGNGSILFQVHQGSRAKERQIR
jgi:hypothetical protein